ncbi:MAG: hypothetical protein ACK5L5_02410 [Bacteroidales bacterium]
MNNNPQIIIGGTWKDVSATKNLVNKENIKLELISTEESESFIMAFELMQQHADDSDSFKNADSENFNCIKISCSDNTLNACTELMNACTKMLEKGGEITLLPLSMNMLTKDQWFEIIDEDGDSTDKVIDIFTDILVDENNEDILISIGMQSFGLKDYFIDGFEDFEDAASNLDSICRFVVGEEADIAIQESIAIGDNNECVYMASEPSAEMGKEDRINNQFGYIELINIEDE